MFIRLVSAGKYRPNVALTTISVHKQLCVFAREPLMNLLIALLTITTSASPPLFFDSDAILDVQLAGPVSTLIRKRRNHPELPFVLTVSDVEHQIQVRLLRITYSEIDGGKKSPIQYAFVIEEEAGMAQRQNYRSRFARSRNDFIVASACLRKLCSVRYRRSQTKKSTAA